MSDTTKDGLWAKVWGKKGEEWATIYDGPQRSIAGCQAEYAQDLIDVIRRKRAGLSSEIAAIPQEDARKYQQFWVKYALGQQTRPSCFRCGTDRNKGDWAITHAELPDIYVCRQCVSAPQAAPSATAAIREKLTLLQVGKCSCLTKTPELKYHDERCTYRLASELEAMLAAAPAPAQAEPVARTPADYAIEHGEYLATAAMDFLIAVNNYDTVFAEDSNATEPRKDAARESRSEHWTGLQSAIHEFRKRAERAKAAPAAPVDSQGNAVRVEETAQLDERAIVKLVYEHFDKGAASVMLFERWKDGIELDYPTVNLKNFCRALLDGYRMKGGE